MVMQRPAKPCTPVRFRPQPPQSTSKAIHQRPQASINAGFLVYLLSLTGKAKGGFSVVRDWQRLKTYPKAIHSWIIPGVEPENFH